MKEFKTIYQIADLISKEILGDLTEEEKGTLQNWVEESQENLMLYSKLVRCEGQKERDEYVSILNVKLAWEKVSAGIGLKPKVIRFKEWSLRVAAVLILGVLIGALYHVSTRDLKHAVELAKVEPGSSKVILQLHDGKTVQLESVLNDSITEADGTLIRNQKGMLEYEVQDNEAKQILYNTVKVPVGGEYQLSLADGTRVWLNSDSEIKYPVQFSREKRKVWIAGEVYFDVAHDKKKPFVVGVKDVEVEVLGTEFNVEAYDDQKSIITTLVEGSVRLSKEKESVIIKPDQQAVIVEGEKQFAVNNVNASNYALWKDGIFYFEQASLEVIMDKLERCYGVKVFYMNQSVKEKRFSIEVKRYKDIDDVLNILSKTNKVHFDINSNVVTVKN